MLIFSHVSTCLKASSFLLFQFQILRSYFVPHASYCQSATQFFLVGGTQTSPCFLVLTSSSPTVPVTPCLSRASESLMILSWIGGLAEAPAIPLVIILLNNYAVALRNGVPSPGTALSPDLINFLIHKMEVKYLMGCISNLDVTESWEK